MAEAIKISLESNAAEIVDRLNRFPAEMAQAICRALDYENELTVGAIVRERLSYPRAFVGPLPHGLRVQTSRLRRSIRPSKARVVGSMVDSAIGSNVRYAGVHEFGFDGVVPVSAHTRHQVSEDVIQGKAGAARRGFEARQKREKVIASGVARVRAHSRKVHLPARAYVRTTIAERVPAYTSALSRAIVQAWTGGAS